MNKNNYDIVFKRDQDSEMDAFIIKKKYPYSTVNTMNYIFEQASQISKLVEQTKKLLDYIYKCKTVPKQLMKINIT